MAQSAMCVDRCAADDRTALSDSLRVPGFVDALSRFNGDDACAFEVFPREVLRHAADYITQC